MATCGQCGAEAYGRFCNNCGGKLPEGASGPDNFGVISQAPQDGVMADNMASAMCYLLWGVTGVFFLVTEPYSRNRTVRFHALQSIFATVAWAALWMMTFLLSKMLPFVLSAILSFLSMAYMLGFVVLWLGLMYKAYNGEKLMLPVVGSMAEQQA
jgi:uncharacterized membrane protein